MTCLLNTFEPCAEITISTAYEMKAGCIFVHSYRYDIRTGSGLDESNILSIVLASLNRTGSTDSIGVDWKI